MIQEAVNTIVEKIADAEVKAAVKEKVDNRIDSLVTTQINKVLEKGIAGAIEKTLTKKFNPILKQIEKIDVTSIVANIAKISLGDEIDGMITELSGIIKLKIKTGIEQAKLIEVDVSSVNVKANEIIAEEIEDILDDDDDVKDVIQRGVVNHLKEKLKVE